MKKILLILFVTTSLSAFAQTEQLTTPEENNKTGKCYINLKIGANTNGLTPGVLTNEISMSDESYYYDENIKYSLGKGIEFGGSLGVILNPNMSIQLDLSYLQGSQNTYYDYYYSSNLDWERDYTLYSNMFKIEPVIMMSFGKEKLQFYTSIGPTIGVGNIFLEEEGRLGDISDFTKEKINGDVALGINSTIGICNKINRITSFFIELEVDNLHYSPTKGEVVDGRYGSTYLTETVFVDAFGIDFDDPIIDARPMKTLRQTYNYNSIGLNIGLRFYL